jgi:hypothetical protein
MPIRARSFSDPVERIISTTSDQLNALYNRGLFAVGEATPPEEMALQIEKQNLMARINLPMGRVEIRTDEGGHSLDLDIANLTLNISCFYLFDPQFARFRRPRGHPRPRQRNPRQHGMRAEIANPFTAADCHARFLVDVEQLRRWRKPNLWATTPLVEMVSGATRQKMRPRSI